MSFDEKSEQGLKSYEGFWKATESLFFCGEKMAIGCRILILPTRSASRSLDMICYTIFCRSNGKRQKLQILAIQQNQNMTFGTLGHVFWLLYNDEFFCLELTSRQFLLFAWFLRIECVQKHQRA